MNRKEISIAIATVLLLLLRGTAPVSAQISNIGVRTNIAAWAVASPSLGVDVQWNQRWQATLDGHISLLSDDPDNGHARYLRASGARAEVRRYFKAEQRSSGTLGRGTSGKILDMETLGSTLEGVLNTRSMDKPFAAATGAISRGSAIGSSTGAISRGAGTRAASIYAAQTTFTIDAQGNFTTRVRLLGIDSTAAQRLVLTLTYKDTTVPPYVYSNDVSSVIAGFNAGATNQPAYLQALLSFGLDGITGTINGWAPAPPEDLLGE